MLQTHLGLVGAFFLVGCTQQTQPDPPQRATTQSETVCPPGHYLDCFRRRQPILDRPPYETLSQ